MHQRQSGGRSRMPGIRATAAPNEQFLQSRVGREYEKLISVRLRSSVAPCKAPLPPSPPSKEDYLMKVPICSSRIA